MAKTPSKKPEAKKPEQAGTAVAKHEEKAMVLIQDNAPAFLNTTGEGRGSENVHTDDLVIPRLEVLQALSPMCTKGDPTYQKAADPGMLTNSVTNQLYGGEVFVVPVHYSKQWLVWIDRKAGGGFRGAFPDPDAAEKRKVEVMKEEGKQDGQVQVIDTPTHLCLLVNRDAGSVDEIIISMPRTKAKVSRQWNSMIRMAGGDRFARVYRIASQGEKNAKGDFHNFVVAQSGFPNQVLYKKAEALYKQVTEGTRRVVMDVQGYDTGEDPGSEM